MALEMRFWNSWHQADVHQVDLVVVLVGQDDVGGAQGPVDDALSVAALQDIEDLQDRLQGRPERHRSLLKALGEGLAGGVRADQDELVLETVDLLERDQARKAGLGGGLDLVAEADLGAGWDPSTDTLDDDRVAISGSVA